MQELARFFDFSLDLLCIADFDGHFKRLNPAWMTRLGWTLEELKDKPFLDFVHPDDREATRAATSNLVQGAQMLHFENRYRHQDGSYRWLRWNARSLLEHQQIYAIARDITQEKWLEREILEIADREKERLGWELHDSLCQNLTGIVALSSVLSRRLAAPVESDESALAKEITQLLKETIQHARDLARCLSPIGLHDIGLRGTLESLALNVQHLFRVICTLKYDCFDLRLRLEVERHLFRLVQEAVSNAITHGQAKRIDINLSTTDGKGVVSIRDDGVGMSENVRKTGGIGMHTMAYRACLIGGSLEVRRCSQRGMVVTCTFPLSETPETGPCPP